MGIFSALKSDKPKFKKVKEEGCVVTLSVEVAPQEVTDQSQTALMRLQSLARIPGFRAGKAPIDIVKQHFAGRAREEAIDALIRKHVPAALEDLKLRVVETPAVSDVKWKEGEPLVITVQAEIAPTPVAKDYLKIPVARKPAAADAAALDRRIEELRDAQARLDISKDEAVGESNFVVIDYSASQGGKPLANAKGTSELVDMSSEQSVEGLSQGLKGMKRGETKTIKVKLGGKETDLTVTVTEIKTKVLPAVDAEFAKDMGMESLDELKAKLKEVLDREVKSASESDVVRQIEEALVKLLSDPTAAVREAASVAMDRTRAKRSMEEFRTRIRGDTVEEKLRAIYAAGDLGGPEGISLLLLALSDGSAEIRGAAVRVRCG